MLLIEGIQKPPTGWNPDTKRDHTRKVEKINDFNPLSRADDRKSEKAPYEKGYRFLH